MSKDIFKELDEDYNKMRSTGDKITEIVSSIGMGFAASSLLAALIGQDGLAEYIAITTGGTILTSPPIYFGLKMLKNKLDERSQRDKHQVSQIAIMYQEVNDRDRRIGSMTALFLNEILDIFEKENKDFPEDQIMNINQFLYLINSNYYERIKDYIPELSREKLIRKLVEQVSIYLNDNKREMFDENDAVGVLSYCVFIPDEIKKEIALEFKRSKATSFGTTVYEIVRNDVIGEIDKYKERKKEEVQGLYTGFDIDKGNDYYELILSYIEDPIT